MTKEEILNMPTGREIDERVGYIVYPDAKKHGFIVCPKYSTDIKDAWEVVEKLCNENGCDILKVCKRDPELLRGEWSCNFGLGCEAFGETAPLAICRAALLSTFVEE